MRSADEIETQSDIVAHNIEKIHSSSSEAKQVYP